MSRGLSEARRTLPHRASACYLHRVAFYETNARGVVHDASFLHFLERARTVWMDRHDRSYQEYISSGLNIATTRVDLRLLRPVRFDDSIAVTTWLHRAGVVSLRMSYEVRRSEELIATATTEHASVDDHLRPRRFPKAWRDRLALLAEEIR